MRIATPMQGDRTQDRGRGDAPLVARARAGEREAFDALVRVHFRRVYGTLFHLVGNHEDAEDLAQETFARGYRALPFYREEGSFEGWLVRIAVHLARDHGRRRGRRPDWSGAPLGSSEGEVDPAEERPGPRRESGLRELTRALGDGIAALPEALRIALVLRTLEGMNYDDVARATGVRPATARTQVMKARRLLTRLLRPHLEGRTEGGGDRGHRDAEDER